MKIGICSEQVEDDFHGFSHRNCEGTEQLQLYFISKVSR